MLSCVSVQASGPSGRAVWGRNSASANQDVELRIETGGPGMGSWDGLLLAGLVNLDRNMVVAWVRAPEIGTT